MADTRQAILLWLPAPLKREVTRLAHQNQRSVTREIQIALERLVSTPPAPATNAAEN
jgi:hypothetical protein